MQALSISSVKGSSICTTCLARPRSCRAGMVCAYLRIISGSQHHATSFSSMSCRTHSASHRCLRALSSAVWLSPQGISGPARRSRKSQANRHSGSLLKSSASSPCKQDTQHMGQTQYVITRIKQSTLPGASSTHAVLHCRQHTPTCRMHDLPTARATHC